MGVLIDLGAERQPERPDDVAAGPLVTRRRLRQFAAAVGVSLLFAAGGSAPPPPPPLTEVAAVPLGPDQTFALAGERLFVGLGEAGRPRFEVVAYELGHGSELWRTTVDVGAQVWAQIPVQPVAGLVLVAAPNVTTALDAATGEVRWSAPYLLSALGDGRTGLVIEDVFPADAVVNPGDSEGAEYIDASGRHYSRPPQAVARGVDLASGALLWASDLLTDVQVLDRGAGRHPAEVLVVTKEGRVEVRDGWTGAVRRAADRIAGWKRGSSLLTGGLLLVRDEATLRAYEIDTLRPRWTRPDSGWFAEDCGRDLVCLRRDDGVEVVDARTGVVRFRRDRSSSYRQVAGHLVEIENDRPVRTLDPRTGRTLIDLSPWARVGLNPFSNLVVEPADQNVPVVLIRAEAAGSRLGLLEPGASAVRSLGAVPQRMDRCQVAMGVLACRAGLSELRIWRFR